MIVLNASTQCFQICAPKIANKICIKEWHFVMAVLFPTAHRTLSISIHIVLKYPSRCQHMQHLACLLSVISHTLCIQPNAVASPFSLSFFTTQKGNSATALSPLSHWFLLQAAYTWIWEVPSKIILTIMLKMMPHRPNHHFVIWIEKPSFPFCMSV